MPRHSSHVPVEGARGSDPGRSAVVLDSSSLLTASLMSSWKAAVVTLSRGIALQKPKQCPYAVHDRGTAARGGGAAALADAGNWWPPGCLATLREATSTTVAVASVQDRTCGCGERAADRTSHPIAKPRTSSNDACSPLRRGQIMLHLCVARCGAKSTDPDSRNAMMKCDLGLTIGFSTLVVCAVQGTAACWRSRNVPIGSPERRQGWNNRRVSRWLFASYPRTAQPRELGRCRGAFRWESSPCGEGGLFAALCGGCAGPFGKARRPGIPTRGRRTQVPVAGCDVSVAPWCRGAVTIDVSVARGLVHGR